MMMTFFTKPSMSHAIIAKENKPCGRNNMESVIDILFKPQNVAVTAYVAMIIGIINVSITIRSEFKKRPKLIMEFPKRELNYFFRSSENTGYVIAFIKLTNKSSLPLHIDSFNLHHGASVNTFDSLSPLYSSFYLNQLEYINIGPDENILRPNLKIEPYSSVQGFIYFENLVVADDKFKLVAITPTSTFKVTLPANEIA